jgi:acetaldehyde dehydrogenase
LSRKIKAGIIGPGNIGSDLMMKLLKSDKIEVTSMFGIKESRGMKMARENGLKTFANGIDGIHELSEDERPEILFDATSAGAHQYNNKVAQELGIRMVDLTPAAIGPFTSPSVNLEEFIDEPNVNMITCGGQATTPIVAAVNDVAPVEYAEIVATISSESAGPGTRANIDEFTETTSEALEVVGGAKKGKAIIILNPAEPPIIMRDTIYTIIDGEFDEEAVVESIRNKEKEIQTYVPGFRLRQDPVIDGQQVSVYVEVEGAGDYLPVYSGNLDIMTASAIGVAERIADNMLEAKTEEVQ